MSAWTDPAGAAAPTTGVARPRTNGFGRAALIVGLVTVLIQLAESIVARLAPLIQSSLQLSASQIGLLFIPFELASGLIGLVALVLGIVGLTRRGLPKGAAGAGTALGGSAAFFVVVSFIAQGLAGLAY